MQKQYLPRVDENKFLKKRVSLEIENFCGKENYNKLYLVTDILPKHSRFIEVFKELSLN